MSDPFDLQRFVDAQAPVFKRVSAELAAGRKRSHWMWFVFPQIAGLGSSPMAQRYALSGLDEAGAYLAHPILGSRLRDCTALVLAVEGRTIHEIFGSPDDLKLRSSMTLFASTVQDRKADTVFEQVLSKFFDGKPDPATLARLGQT